MKKKTTIIILSIFIAFIVLSYAFEGLMYTSTNYACGTFFKESEIRGVNYFHYRVKINNVDREGSIWLGDIKLKSLDSLKKLDCIRIEYSNYFTYFNRVVDKRVLK